MPTPPPTLPTPPPRADPAVPQPGRPSVRLMTVADLPFVVTEHRRSLPDGLYPRLGAAFLTRYHAGYLASPGSVSLVAELGGQRHRRTGCTRVTLATQLGPSGAVAYYANRGWIAEGVHWPPTGPPMQVMAWTWPTHREGR